MATPGEMVATMAAALGKSEVLVGSYYRAVREAELIRTGGRGRSAARVQPLDVTRLLVAMLCADVVRDVPESVRVFGNLQRSHSEVDAMDLPTRKQVCAERLEDALASVLIDLARFDPAADAASSVDRYAVNIDVSERRATLVTKDEDCTYGPGPNPLADLHEQGLGLHITRSVGGRVLQLLAAIATEPRP